MRYPFDHLLALTKRYQLDIEAHILHRGLHYWERGAVVDVETAPDGSLAALVIGGDDYEVSLDWHSGAGGARWLEGRCDCPYPDVCKHIGALFIEFVDREQGDSAEAAVAQCLDALAALARPPAAPAQYARLLLKMARPVDCPPAGGTFSACS